ncbi:LacI family transcriptional regulator [Cohnella sp. CIP 111063]|jgi:simple sugar transport system substrate-binding protein|uniref:sugar ABC transporter substrate-binding protein n=1 Tax=unclassified Cohnella TaxID=2636738 RepID=UPI000B8C294F|nr:MULTISPECIES: sugar ABC transporter substrate-binding protein [unclassified Cohnella]OXS61203.1 LacI family transcriptional regulator [Cohnella sp. CIP 111063]PRX73768.1 monosaccharide ABC transporter substrate-binding protein (CUT2 family) [Cohnella sp. SGD-V74]
MKQRKSKLSWIALALTLVLVLAACGKKEENNAGSSSPASPSASAAASESASAEPSQDASIEALKGKRIALVMRFNTGTFSAQYVDGVKKQVAKFGGEVTVLASENDLAKMAANLDSAVNQKFDGILVDHGDAAALTNGLNKAKEAGIPIVAFDSGLNDFEGITNLAQNDQLLAEYTLEKLAEEAGGKGNIVKVWVAGFPPMESRQISYKAFTEKYPDIKEIAAFGDASNPQLDTQNRMEAVLKQYPNKGDITAVWASWDEFAKGASNAIKQAGRDEIKVYGIDLSDEDLKIIQDPTSPWVASAAVDPTSIGTVQVRYLYQKFHGDTTDAVVQLEPVFVHRDSLPTDKVITTDELSQYVEGWGSSDLGNTDYLTALEQAVGAQ